MRMFQGPVIFYDVRLPEVAQEVERSENISEELSVEELLKGTNFTVTEVSAKIGYPNYACFTKLFKKYSGYTPSAYRNRFGRKN